MLAGHIILESKYERILKIFKWTKNKRNTKYTNDWNFLGEEKINISDFINYETSAFDINLSLSDVKDPSIKIWKIYSKYHSLKTKSEMLIFI